MRLTHVCGGCGVLLEVTPLGVSTGNFVGEANVKFLVPPCTRCRAQLIEQIRAEEEAKRQSEAYKEGGA